MQIVVLGYIIRGPLGGLCWHHLQYVLGLKQLGHQILFLEDSDDFPSCYNPETFEITSIPDYGLNFINDLFAAFDIKDKWAYFDAFTNKWYGNSQQYVFDFCNRADLVLNLSGVNLVRDWWSKIQLRVFVDTDPGFTQIKHLTDKKAFEQAIQHNRFFSFAENIKNCDCLIPDDNLNWKPTRQPIYLKAWEIAPFCEQGKWTTVMQWDSYKSREYNNLIFGMKSMSFNEFENVPAEIKKEKFELALGSENAPAARLIKNGWEIINPLLPTKSPWSYQEYLAKSKGEWTIAKQGYVISKSGWFSERTLCYMASGKPVIVQDTGFSNYIETGKGLFGFNNMEEIKESIKKINTEYVYHCYQARQLVEESFNSNNILSKMLGEIA